jgi:hypothetical protein
MRSSKDRGDVLLEVVEEVEEEGDEMWCVATLFLREGGEEDVPVLRDRNLPTECCTGALYGLIILSAVGEEEEEVEREERVLIVGGMAAV